MRHSQLHAFHAVALHGGFSRAAEAVRQTQPALSENVRRLEQAHDVLLFHRDRRQVRLTAAGEGLFLLTKRYFEAEGQIGEYLSESRAAPEGVLRIVADSAHHVTAALARFRARHPRAFVSIGAGNTEEVLAALRAWDAEIGVVGALPPGGEFETVDLGASPVIAFAARGYQGTEAGSISMRDLAQAPLVFREKGSRTRQLIEEEAARRGLRLAPAIEVEGREALREVVASGAGVGLVSEAEFGEDARLVRLPIRDAAMAMSETLICLKQRRDLRIIRAFMDMAQAGREQGAGGMGA